MGTLTYGVNISVTNECPRVVVIPSPAVKAIPPIQVLFGIPKCEIFHRLNIQVHLALGLMEFAAQTILKKVAIYIPLFFQKTMFAMQLLSQIRVVCSNEVNI